jgi:hypothetical protein
MPWGAAPLPAEQVHWTAEALRVLYEVSREARLLDAGQQAMDHLCSYQQIGSSNTRAAFGAFVLDREAQRVGARFCETFLHYYCLTGLREYFERGVAALRASFENSGDPEALAAAAAIERRFGSLYVDGERGFVSAVDGCRVRVTKPVELRAEVVDVLGRARSIDIVVDGLPPRAKLRWNGRTLKFRRVAGSARACAALEAHGKGSFALRYQRPPKARLSARKKRW